MRIDSIQLFRLHIDVEVPSSGGPPRESIIARIESDGQSGFGEVCLAAGPTESEEWSAGAFACLRDWLAPALVGKSTDSGEQVQELLRPFHGNAAAKSALDTAWWFLRAVVQNKPPYQLLGGDKDAGRVSYTIGVMDSADQWMAQVREAIERCELVTLKFRPGWDVEMLRAVRQEFPQASLAIDCDGLCTLGQQEMFYRLEDFNLRFIEQPLAADDLVGHAMLQSSLRTPICLDQSIGSLDRMEQAIDLGSCRMARINIARVGGLTTAIAIRDACRLAKFPCGVDGAQLSFVSIVACVALATSCDLPLSLTYGGAQMNVGNQISLSESVSAPGLALDTESLALAAVEQATIR